MSTSGPPAVQLFADITAEEVAEVKARVSGLEIHVLQLSDDLKAAQQALRGARSAHVELSNRRKAQLRFSSRQFSGKSESLPAAILTNSTALLLQILETFSYKEKLAIQRVCRHWRFVICESIYVPAQAVMHNAELLEAIFLHLPQTLGTIVPLQGVCYFWKNVARNSPGMLRKLDTTPVTRGVLLSKEKLLAKILVELRPRQIFVGQRVCKQWSRVIKRSPTILLRTGLREKVNTEEYLQISYSHSLVAALPPLNVPSHMLESSRETSFIWDKPKNASWKKRLIYSPAPTQVTVIASIERDRWTDVQVEPRSNPGRGKIIPYTVQKKIRTQVARRKELVINDHGVTLGDVFDLANQVWRHEKQVIKLSIEDMTRANIVYDKSNQPVVKKKGEWYFAKI